jgi:hypothetical protein
MSEQLQRIRFVTTYYDWLQGLRFLPLGLFPLGVSVWLALPWREQVDAQTRGEVGLGLTLAGLALAAALYAWLGAYYRRRFGVVRRSPSTHQRMRRAILVSLGVGIAAALATRMLRASTPVSQEPPLFAMLLLAGLGMVWYWHWTGRFVRHYLAVAVGFVGLAALHALEVNPVCALLRALPFTTDSRCAGVTLTAAWGVAVLVMAVLDHRLLASTLGPEPESEPESEEVPG